eukprot:3190758-Pyramimonas_sp.AAC.1
MLVSDQESVDRCQALKMCEGLFRPVFPKAHGDLFDASRRPIHHIAQALWAVIFRWNGRDRKEYYTNQYVPKITMALASDKFEH